MPDDKITGEDLEIVLSDQVKGEIANHPEVAAAIRDFSARVRQAQQDFHDGKFASFDEAMMSMGASPVDLDEVSDDSDEG